MHSRSAVVGPGRSPWSRSARLTQWRSVSPEQPIFSAIEWIADHCEGCSAWWSSTIRTARARTSGEYGGTRFVMAPSSQELEPPEIPARFRNCCLIAVGGRFQRKDRSASARCHSASSLSCPNASHGQHRARVKADSLGQMGRHITVVAADHLDAYTELRKIVDRTLASVLV